MNKKKHLDRLPPEFASREEAADFWGAHDTRDYPRAFRTVRVEAELRHRYFEIPIDAEVAKTLRVRARNAGVNLGEFASNLLRRRLRTSA